MGDHFVLLVDRLLTESTLEAAIESRNRLMQATASSADDSELEKPCRTLDVGDLSTPGKLVECRICQDEDLDSNMETPCSCCGSLKYAHRRCVQRWCNEKGNIVCEICHQQFKPNYTAPPPLFQIGRIPLNFRGHWEMSRRDIQGARVIAMVSTDRALLNNPNYDEHSSSISRIGVSFRLVVLVFMVLLILRHALPVVFNGTAAISFRLILLLLLRTAGIILPIYVMMRLVTALQHRRSLHVPPNSSFSSDEEAENSSLTAQQHVIDVD